MPTLQAFDSTEIVDTRPPTREEMILQCMPVVYSIARRLICSMSQEVALEDLISAGTVGLIHAVDNYDARTEVKLQTYAAHRIRGAMLDNLREHDWFSRRQRSNIKRLHQAMASAQARLGNLQVADEEVAAELGVSVEEYRDQIAAMPVTRIVSLEEALDRDGEGLEPCGGDLPSEILERAQMAEMLEDALARIPKEEQIVLSLYYQEGLTPQEISEVTQYPIKRVYQLKAQAILRLRGNLGRRVLRKNRV